MASVAKRIFYFQGYTLDLRRGGLRRDERAIELRPKSFEVLRHLVENAGRLVEKEELIRSIWSSVTTTDEALTRCISEIRLALGDDGPRIIKTVPRRGYLFEAPVVATEEGQQSEPPRLPSRPTSEGSGAHDLPPRLSIAVRPFKDLRGAGGPSHFAEAITEALTIDLSRLRDLTVTAQGTVRAQLDKAADVNQVGRDLGVRFVVEGSLQTVKDRVRVGAQLVDATTGRNIWADRFDVPWSDCLEMQDRITARLARTVGLEVVASESLRAERERANAMDTLDLTLRGKAIWNRLPSLQGAREARAQFEAAIRLDDRNVGALVGLAKAYAFEVSYFGSSNPGAHTRVAEDALAAAMALAPDSPSVRMCRAQLLCVLGRPEEALWEYEGVDGFVRTRATAHAHMGLLKLLLGRAEETEAHVVAAIQRSPHDPWTGQWYFYLGAAHLYLGRTERAVASLRRSVSANPAVALYRLYLAAALAMNGAAQAVEIAAEARALAPGLSIGRFRSGGPSRDRTFLDQREQVIEGMRRAGIPE
jgi:TolB-like protein